jgi:hypothetical protein
VQRGCYTTLEALKKNQILSTYFLTGLKFKIITSLILSLEAFRLCSSIREILLAN